MGNHASDPNSVETNHAPEGESDDGTIGSIVVDVNSRSLRTCAGNPCLAERRKECLEGHAPGDGATSTVLAAAFRW